MTQFLDQVALHTEHHDVTRIEALTDMCQAAIAVYDGTDEQYVADWAREALRLLYDRAEQDAKGGGG
jgi:hypothetical protein